MNVSGTPVFKISVVGEKSSTSVWKVNYSDVIIMKPSFYKPFCRFITPMKYLGYFPLTLTKSSSGISFSITSLLFLLSLFGFVSIYVVIVVFYPSTDPLVQLSMYARLTIPMIDKVLFFWHLPDLIKLLKLMDCVDRDKCLPNAKENINKSFIKAILGFVLVTLTTSLSPQNLITTNLNSDVIHNYVFRCHSVICTVCPLSVYYFICYHMCNFYDRYHSSLNSLLDQDCDKVSEKCVEDHRICHGKLVNCIRLLNNSFSSFLGFLYFSINVRCLMECYDFIYNNRPRSRSFQALQMIVLLVFVYYPAVLTDRFIQKNNNTINYILKLALKPFPDNVLFQVTYFLRHLKMNKAHVSAGGVSQVNKELITKAMSLFATFFVATLQLVPLLQRGLVALRELLRDVRAQNLSGN